METENFKGVRYAGFYAIVHFGTKNEHQNIPLFMKADEKFTSNPRHAYISTCREDVEMMACKLNKKLEMEGHPLAGCILPVSVMVSDPNYEEPKAKLPNGAESLGFWWFTFGLAHPLSGMVQGVFASDETSAREVMHEFYGSVWSSCYKAHCPTYESELAKITIGGEAYAPITRFLKEGEKYE